MATPDFVALVRLFVAASASGTAEVLSQLYSTLLSTRFISPSMVTWTNSCIASTLEEERSDGRHDGYISVRQTDTYAGGRAGMAYYGPCDIVFGSMDLFGGRFDPAGTSGYDVQR